MVSKESVMMISFVLSQEWKVFNALKKKIKRKSCSNFVLIGIKIAVAVNMMMVMKEFVKLENYV